MPQESHDPHPENSAGTAHEDSARNTDDVAGTHRCGKSGAQTLELGYAFVVRMGSHMLVMENSADGLLHPVAEMGHLENLRQHGHQDSDKCQQDQGGNSPDNTVHGVVHIGNTVQESAACFFCCSSRCTHQQHTRKNPRNRLESLGHSIPTLSKKIIEKNVSEPTARRRLCLLR